MSRVHIPIIWLFMATGIALGQESNARFSPKPITDPARYDTGFAPLLAQHPHTKHFPDSIPSEATDTIFYYIPKILQGAEIVFLGYELPCEQVERIKTTMLEKAIRVVRITEKDYRPM